MLLRPYIAMIFSMMGIIQSELKFTQCLKMKKHHKYLSALQNTAINFLREF